MKKIWLTVLLLCFGLTAFARDAADDQCRRVLINSQGVRECLDKENDPPSEWEIIRQLVAVGHRPFTLRSWRVDFIDGWSTAGDCSSSGSTIRLSSPKATYTYYYNLNYPGCGETGILLKFRRSTEGERPPPADDYETVTWHKPNFKLSDILAKGATLGPRHAGLAISGLDGSVEMTLPDGLGSWSYDASEAPDGTITLKPVKGLAIRSIHKSAEMKK
jgi:hypothetical protein